MLERVKASDTEKTKNQFVKNSTRAQKSFCFLVAFFSISVYSCAQLCASWKSFKIAVARWNHWKFSHVGLSQRCSFPVRVPVLRYWTNIFLSDHSVSFGPLSSVNVKYFKSDAPNVNFLQERANNILFSLSSPSVRVHNIKRITQKHISSTLDYLISRWGTTKWLLCIFSVFRVLNARKRKEKMLKKRWLPSSVSREKRFHLREKKKIKAKCEMWSMLF